MSEEISSTVETSQPTESKSTDWTKVILVAVLGFGLLAGSAYAGYWYGTQEISKLKDQISKPESKNQIPEIPTTPSSFSTEPTDEVDETVGWKVYKNTSYGYQLRYPSNWGVQEWDNTGSPPTVSQHTLELQGEGLMLQVNVWANPAKYLLRQWVEEVYRHTGALRRQMQFPQEPDLEVANTPAFGAVVSSETNPAVVVLFARGERVYEVFEVGVKDLLQPQSIYDQILSTFKFLD